MIATLRAKCLTWDLPSTKQKGWELNRDFPTNTRYGIKKETSCAVFNSRLSHDGIGEWSKEMEVCGQFQAPSASLLGKETPVPIVQEPT
jgi:hypothetical protein